MTAQIDIRTGERSLMSYLLKPIRKTLAESFGEL
jgi:membrane fusion protein, adhesin transport system